MKTVATELKDLKYYMNLPWEFDFKPCEQGGYYAKVKGISCHSHGDTLEQAVTNIKEALECHIESYIEDGELVPEPINEESCNGRLSIRVSKSLHCKLARLSKDEDVSVSHLVNDALVKMYDKVS